MPIKDPVKRNEYRNAYRAARKLAGLPGNNPKTLAAYRENNREKQRRYNRSYYLAHKTKISAQCKAWREANKEKDHAYRREYRKTFKSRFLIGVCAKAKKRKIPVVLTLEQYTELVRRNACAYCGETLPVAGSGLDRKNSTLGYTFDNCIACCRACNEIRGHDNITYTEMLEVAKFLRALRKRKSKP